MTAQGQESPFYLSRLSGVGLFGVGPPLPIGLHDESDRVGTRIGSLQRLVPNIEA